MSEEWAMTLEELAKEPVRPRTLAELQAESAATGIIEIGPVLPPKLNPVAIEDAKVRKEVEELVVKGAIDASYLDDEGQPVDGQELYWTKRRKNVAKDHRLPSRSRPGYIDVAARVLESYKKSDDARVIAPVLNGDIKVYVNRDLVFNYPSKVVEDNDE